MFVCVSFLVRVKLIIHLPQPFEFLKYRHAPPHPDPVHFVCASMCVFVAVCSYMQVEMGVCQSEVNSTCCSSGLRFLFCLLVYITFETGSPCVAVAVL